MSIVANHTRRLHASAPHIVVEEPKEVMAVHAWICSALEKVRIAEEQAAARYEVQRKRRLAQARNAA